MVDFICNPAEKLLSSNTLVQDRSVEEAEKGFRGELFLQWVLCFFVWTWSGLMVIADNPYLQLDYSGHLKKNSSNNCLKLFLWSVTITLQGQPTTSIHKRKWRLSVINFELYNNLLSFFLIVISYSELYTVHNWIW